MKKWMGEFGKEYTDRNILNVKQMDEMYTAHYGITRRRLNQLFIGHLPRAIKILEVGSNIGSQLLCLQKIGFRNLYGIEINSYAIELSKSRTKNINIIQGSAFDIPFKDSCFDLVFTSGVLIHIAPFDINTVIREVYRCTRKYIWGFEYYANEYTEVLYRGRRNMLWKANFPKLYLDLFNNLELVKEKCLKYLDNDNMDVMFLLKKR